MHTASPAGIYLLLFWLCLPHLRGVFALKGDSACTYRAPKNVLCVNATLENDVVTYQLTAMQHNPEEVGWIGLGFGDQMLGSPMVIMWRNEDNTMTLSQRAAKWYAEPQVVNSPPRIATVVEPKITAWHPANSTTYAFQIPANQTLLSSSSPAENLIWALSPIRPAKEPQSHIARHFENGYLQLDLTKELSPDGGAQEPSPSKPDKGAHDGHEKTVLAHGFLLTFGFLILLPIGVLTPRWTRTLTPIWFKVHWISNWALALPVISLGFVLGLISVFQHGAPHFNDPHKLCGVFLFLLYVAQTFLGRYIHRRRAAQTAPIKNNHPPFNILHVVIGLLVLVFAFLQVRSGLYKVQAAGFAKLAHWGLRLWAFWAAAVPFVYLVGLYLLPKQFTQERASSGESAYVALAEDSQSPSTQLLFENTEDDDDAENTRKPYQGGRS